MPRTISRELPVFEVVYTLNGESKVEHIVAVSRAAAKAIVKSGLGSADRFKLVEITLLKGQWERIKC